MSGESLTFPLQIPVIEKYAGGKEQLVEVGVCFGGTSKILRAAMAENGTLNLVDPFPAKLPQSWKGQPLLPDIEVAKANVESVQRGSVRWFVMTSEVASRMFGAESVDFVFIDGLHDEDSVQLDWRVWSPKVKQGGIILFHDVADYCPGVMRVWERIKDSPGWECLGIEMAIGVMKRL